MGLKHVMTSEIENLERGKLYNTRYSNLLIPAPVPHFSCSKCAR